MTEETSNEEYYVVLQNDRLYLRWFKEAVERVKQIPGHVWKKKWGCWEFPANGRVVANLITAFPDIRIHPDVYALHQKYVALKDNSLAAKVAEGLPDPPSKMPSWNHQKQAFHFLLHLPAGGLFMDMGTGKTKVAIDLLFAKGFRRVLIICPKAVIDVWPTEFEKYANKPYRMVPIKGSALQKVLYLEQGLKLNDGVMTVFVVNYESAWRNTIFGILEKGGFDCILLDESHRIKAAGSRISIACYALGKKIPNRLCLTGTPMPDNPLDVYGQYRFLDPTIFGTNFDRFKKRYAKMSEFNQYEVEAYINQDELAEKMHEIAFRVKADDVLDLPPAHHIIRYCELSQSARKLYSQFKKEMVADVDGRELTAQLPITKLLRLEQLTGGNVTLDDGTSAIVDESKRELFADLLGDLPKREPVVVFCRFQHDVDTVVAVAKASGRSVGLLNGLSNHLKEWQAAKYDVLVVQIKSGGAGVDLTRARYAFYYSVGHSLGDYEQSLARLHRSGQTRPVTYYHLLAKRTVDEGIYAALSDKRDVVAFLVDALKFGRDSLV